MSQIPIDKVELSGICGRVRCEPGWKLDRAWSARLTDFDLWLVWAGRGVMRVDGRSISLRPGVCLWMQPGRIYEAFQDARNRLGVSYAHFRVGARGDFPPPFDLTEVRSLNFAESTMAQVARWANRDAGLAGRLLANLLEILTCDHGEAQRSSPQRMAAPRRRREQVVRDLLVQIREEPGKKWRVAEMARVAGLAPDHFSRVFEEVTGQRPQALIVENRLMRAQQLLLETPLQIGEIAHALGFRDVFYFSRQFRDHYGLPPSAYRREAGEIPAPQRESSA